MLTLYYKPTCPFCQRVLQMAESLQVDLDLKDVSDDEAAVAEMMDRCGDGEVPFMYDSEKNMVIDESNDIIEHMRTHYAKTADAATVKPKVHISGSVCESCEG